MINLTVGIVLAGVKENRRRGWTGVHLIFEDRAWQTMSVPEGRNVCRRPGTKTRQAPAGRDVEQVPTIPQATQIVKAEHCAPLGLGATGRTQL